MSQTLEEKGEPKAFSSFSKARTKPFQALEEKGEPSFYKL